MNPTTWPSCPGAACGLPVGCQCAASALPMGLPRNGKSMDRSGTCHNIPFRHANAPFGTPTGVERGGGTATAGPKNISHCAGDHAPGPCSPGSVAGRPSLWPRQAALEIRIACSRRGIVGSAASLLPSTAISVSGAILMFPRTSRLPPMQLLGGCASLGASESAGSPGSPARRPSGTMSPHLVVFRDAKCSPYGSHSHTLVTSDSGSPCKTNTCMTSARQKSTSCFQPRVLEMAQKVREFCDRWLQYVSRPTVGTIARLL